MNREMYDLVCKGRLDKQDEKLDKIITMLTGNGKEGLTDTVRRLDKVLGRVCWAIGIIFVAIVGAVAKRFIGG